MDTLAGVNFNPTMYVDITETIDLKIKMLNVINKTIDKYLKENNKENINFILKFSREKPLSAFQISFK